MCKSEKTANARSPQRPPFSAAKPKSMYLVTDNGFARSLTANLVVMAAIMILCTIHPPAHNVALDLYGNINEYIMGIANEMAWWSLLGLLSSSCCAIQILLNALSFGCAGFNTILGPVRPTFVGFTIVAQFSSWYAVYYYHSLGQYTNWKMTVASTALSGIVTLLPELLAWQCERRQNERMLQQQILLMESPRTDKAYEETLHLTFQLSTMGCSSCVSTVSKVLDSIDGVLRHTVSLEDGIAEVEVALSSKYADTNIPHNNATNKAGYSTDHDLLWKDIANRLEAGGFPAEPSLLPEAKQKVQ